MNTGTSRQLRLFLCHASEDKPIVRTLYKKLQTYNMEVWFDERNLIPGERWEHVIPQVIQKCDIILICLSHMFLKKEGYAHYEVHVVLEAAKRKPPDTIFHIPYRLDDCEVPAYLLEWQYASHFIEGDFEKVLVACEKRRVWLNTYHAAHIEPFNASSGPFPKGAELSQDDSSGRVFENEASTASQRPASSKHQAPSDGKQGQEALSSQQKQGALLQRYAMHASWVLAAIWEPRGDRIASAGADGTVRIWEAETGKALLTYHGHARLLSKVNLQTKISTVAWAPDGQNIASAGDGGTVHIWSTKTGQTLTRYEEHSGLWPNISAVAWAPDGQNIASACSHALGDDHTIHLWDTATGQKIRSCTSRYHWLPDFFVHALAWSSDGTQLAAACRDSSLRIWDTTTGGLVSLCQFRSKWANHIAWSPDNRYLASAHPDHTVRIWDIPTQTNILTYYGHTDGVRHVAWSPDGTCLATASDDKTVRLWEALTGAHLYTYRSHDDWVTSVSWSPDGTRIASASNDKTVQVWKV